MSSPATVALVVVATWAVLQVLLSLLRAARLPRVATIAYLEDETAIDESGRVRSVQAADLTLPADQLDAIWSAMHLERLARTYWRFLERLTLGLIRVSYAPGERRIVLLSWPIVLLRFHAPEYELDAEHGLVRWRIKSGLLVARRGRRGDGCLQIDVRRRPAAPPGESVAHVEVAVVNFFPAIAATLGTPVYKATQSRIHVVVTHTFLRSLARLDLARSRVRALEPVEAG